MFFQDAQSDAANAKAKAAVDFNTVAADVAKTTAELRNLNGVMSNTFEQFQRILIQSEELNKTFVGGRLRIQEMTKAINEAAPEVVRLGGDYKDVAKTLSEIAAGTRTQVLATSKDVRQLFAAGEVLDQKVIDIVDAFDKVGYSYNTIADNLANSINYVQSVGQNARAVMKDVVSNTEMLSRFNFSNGVQGLTKMAAQASMLRFDMKKTFDFADAVLDPEKAIEMSSAFQRLGVSIGNLTDPLSLVNQSLTDPSGLQDSLINMTKHFTYFDEQTKSFKVNPQGILTMKELANATGISAAELRKTALAAAEMDSKLAKINSTGLNFEVSDENKMLIANVARMGEGGEYEVSIKDERGYEYQKKLTELQEQDFRRLIEQQSKAPKTIEEIQQSQLNTAEKTLYELRGLKETFVSAFFGLPGVPSGIEGAAQYTRDTAGLLQKSLDEVGFRQTLKSISQQVDDIRAKNLKPEDEKKEIKKLFDESKKQIMSIAPEIFKTAGVLMSDVKSEQNEQVQTLSNVIGKYFESIYSKESGEIKKVDKQLPGTLGTKPNDYGILTPNAVAPIAQSAAALAATSTVKGKSQLDVEFLNPNLTINVNVSGPSGMDSTYLTQVIRDAQNPLKEEIYKAVKNVAISKGEVKSVTA
jgi:hypothetical protein